MNIEINYSDLNYKITQQQKAVSVSELLGKCSLVVPHFLRRFLSGSFFFFSFVLKVLAYQWRRRDSGCLSSLI